MDHHLTPAKTYAEGIGDAVADRTVNRIKPDGTRETWADVAHRVALGNSLLCPIPDDQPEEFQALHHHLRQASILLSGRHLQHGDETQPSRNQEVFTNCSTAATSHILFYLLLNGSGVGRSYDDHMMFVDWRNLPETVIAISADYPDRAKGMIDDSFPTRESALKALGGAARVYEVEDSREGWAHAAEYLEHAAYTGNRDDAPIIVDFSGVRPHGSPIHGMQNRPSSGPAATMQSLVKIVELSRLDKAPWEQAMYVDHYLAESVLVGGARRAARMATKNWRDSTVLDFIRIKRGGNLWSSNNSVMVDEEFWTLVRTPPAAMQEADEITRELWGHAQEVFEAVCYHSYHDGTGEPGLINADKLTANMTGIDTFDDGEILGSLRFKPMSHDLHGAALDRFKTSVYKMITNPCGEITLTMLGGYCVIADVVPYHAASLDDAEDAFRTATRALIRTNLMDCLYRKEVDRTNRIGVGMTGLHEFAYKFFGYGFRDLIDEDKSKDFWLQLARFKRAIVHEASIYASYLGVNVPHTNTTMKPAGTTSKLFGLSEGAHLPSMREYLRYVQFRNDDPLVEKYREAGYPVKDLVNYAGTTIVGFPTVPEICTLGMGDKLVTAAEATPEEQYQYLRLMEKYWIRGVDVDGETLLPETGNQVSYTLKYDPKVVNYEEFRRTLLDGQSSIRCCSVMPQTDASAYEYQPETPVSREEFDAIVARLKRGTVREEVGFEHIDCGSGACPIDFVEGELEEAAPVEAPSKVIIFTQRVCPACGIVKKLLGDAGVEYEEVLIQGVESMEYLRQFTDARTVPIVVMDGQVLQGVEAVKAALASRNI